MSLFRRSTELRSSDGWVPWVNDGSGGSGRGATGLVPFFASIRHIVDFMATLPVDGYRVDGDKRVPTSTPALLRLLDAEGGIGVGNWIGQWAYGLAVDGNAVGWITDWDGYGFPTKISWLQRADWSYSDGQWYVYGHPVPSSQIAHSPWIVPVGKKLGVSPLEHFSEFWQAGLSAQQYADVARGGGIPPSHLKNTSKTLDPGEALQVQARAVKSFASGKPFVTGNDWDLSQTVIPPNQAQFLETLGLTANQTAAVYGLDPREIGGSGASGSVTYSNDESRSLNRANNMRPYIVRFEQFAARLLPEKQYIKLNVDATIRADIKTRTDVVGAKLADGRMSVDEARALEDQEPLPNGQGKFYNVPAPSAGPVNREGDTP